MVRVVLDTDMAATGLKSKMKISKTRLKQILKEEIDNKLKEAYDDRPSDYEMAVRNKFKRDEAERKRKELKTLKQWIINNPGKPFRKNQFGFDMVPGFENTAYHVNLLMKRGEITDVDPKTGESTGHRYETSRDYRLGRYWPTDSLEEIRKNPDLSPKRHKKPGEIKDDGKHADPKRARPKRMNEELTRQDKTDVKKMVKDELEKLLKKKDTKDQMGEIVKKIMKKLYKDLSLEHPYIIDRIKI